jgi:succinyl-CoA synthetase beta subunit
MNLHEYQAKSLFANYGIPVPQGQVAANLFEARSAAQKIGGETWIIKAQAHTGGRGKAGGIKQAHSLDEVQEATQSMLGMTLVTHQTGPKGLLVNNVLVEKGCEIVQELYLGALLDRAQSRITFMASAAGGMDIEEVASNTPEKILTTTINPSTGVMPYQCRRLAFGLGLSGNQIKEFSKIMMALYQLYLDKDVNLIEINPLIVTKQGTLLALDAKINLDSNALYRHSSLLALRDLSQEDPKEAAAAQHDLNYITLDGNIGCMVNGAGLAMATMDMVKLHGGQPANFLDVGGGTTAERVTQAFELILSDDKVKAVLVNIFGGIVRCDLIAEGIITAARNITVTVPIVVRLEGTNASNGLDMLSASELEFITAHDFTQAAKQVVSAAS